MHAVPGMSPHAHMWAAIAYTMWMFIATSRREAWNRIYYSLSNPFLMPDSMMSLFSVVPLSFNTWFCYEEANNWHVLGRSFIEDEHELRC